MREDFTIRVVQRNRVIYYARGTEADCHTEAKRYQNAVEGGPCVIVVRRTRVPRACDIPPLTDGQKA